MPDYVIRALVRTEQGTQVATGLDGVEWRARFEASSARAAAVKARDRRPSSNVFIVTNRDTGQSWVADLSKDYVVEVPP